MAWDEIVFLQPSHFVRHELFGSGIISFGMFWGIILLGTKTSFCRQSRRFVLQNAPPKVTMVIPQGMHLGVYEHYSYLGRSTDLVMFK